MKQSAGKIITCIVPVGVAKPVMQDLYETFGLMQSQFNFARGIGKRSPLSQRGWGEESEKEIFSVVVHAEQADEVFEFLFHKTEINQPHRGIMYMQSAVKTTNYTLPEGMHLEHKV